MPLVLVVEELFLSLGMQKLVFMTFWGLPPLGFSMNSLLVFWTMEARTPINLYENMLVETNIR